MKRHLLICCLCPHGKRYLGVDLESIKIVMVEVVEGTSGLLKTHTAQGNICRKHRRMLKRVMGVTA